MNYWMLQYMLFVGATLASSASTSERRLEALYRRMADDISRIEEKVWVDLTLEIENLKEKLAGETVKRGRLEAQLKALLDQTSSKDSECLEPSLEPSVREDVECECRQLGTKVVALVEGFKSEKNISRSRDKDIANIAESLSQISVKFRNTEMQASDIDSFIQSVTERSVNNTRSVEELEREMVSVQSVQKTIHSRISCLSDTVKMEDSRSPLGGPYFVSPWKEITAQDDFMSDITIEHGLGAIPLKVDVQVKPTTGRNAGWIFPGDSAIQSDDDLSVAYGGVVYFYNASHVRLLVPKKNNNGDSGRVINTGEDNSYWIGDDHQMATTALVRVRVWGGENISPPDFQTRWLPLDITRRELSFYDIQHGIGGYPALVSVQVRVNTSRGETLLSDGMGSLMSHYRHYSTAGGVIHAFSDKAIRIWSPFWTNQTSYFGTLLGARDGWGNHGVVSSPIGIGEVRVSAWSYKSFKLNENLFSVAVDHDASSISVDGGHIALVDSREDLVTCYVQAASGVNKGFRFRGWGSSQNENSPYGGLIYSYDETGRVKLWKPNKSTGGYLIHVKSPNGDGQMMQSSNDALIVKTVIKAHKQDTNVGEC